MVRKPHYIGALSFIYQMKKLILINIFSAFLKHQKKSINETIIAKKKKKRISFKAKALLSFALLRNTLLPIYESFNNLVK